MEWFKIVNYPLANNCYDLWSGRADIVRNDTGEIVETVRVRLIDGKIEAQKILDKKVKGILSKLQQPEDWGNPDLLRLMFFEYDSFSQTREKYHQRMYEGVLNEEVTHVMAEYETKIIEYLLSFQKHYMQMTDGEKILLVGSTVEERNNPELLIEKLTARNFFMKIIIDPSEQVTNAYQEMRKALSTAQAKG